MIPRGPAFGNDNESLQTDVMRFMAIIAFCLIAILALVRNVIPTETAATTTPDAPIPSPPEGAVAEPVLQVTAAEATTQREPLAQQPGPAQPVQQAPMPPLPEITEAESAKTTEPNTLAAISTEPAPDQSPAQEQPVPQQEDALVLRFASDGDFLRLVARGEITVYAFTDSDVLTLNEHYRFLDAAAPGEVYELLEPSVPRLVVNALLAARGRADGYRWGIVLPRRISRQINDHLSRVRRGQLVINRYGEVRHVAG